jgi:hypothetical protein
MKNITRDNITAVMNECLKQLVLQKYAPMGINIDLSSVHREFLEKSQRVFERVEALMAVNDLRSDAHYVEAFVMACEEVFKEDIKGESNESLKSRITTSLSTQWEAAFKQKVVVNFNAYQALLQKKREAPQPSGLKATVAQDKSAAQKRKHFKKITRQDIIDVVEACIQTIINPSPAGLTVGDIEGSESAMVIHADVVSPNEIKNTSDRIFAAMQLLMDHAGRHDDAAFMASFLLAAKMVVSDKLSERNQNPSEILSGELNKQLQMGCDIFDINSLEWEFYDLLLEKGMAEDLKSISAQLNDVSIVTSKSAEAIKVEIPVTELEPAAMESAAGESSSAIELPENTKFADIRLDQLDELLKKYLEQLVRGAEWHAYLHPSTELADDEYEELDPVAASSTRLPHDNGKVPPPPEGSQTMTALIQETTRNIDAHMGVMINKAIARLPGVTGDLKLTPQKLLIGAYVIALKVQLGAEGELRGVALAPELAGFLNMNGLQDVSKKQIETIEVNFLELIEYDASYGQAQTSFASATESTGSAEPSVSQDPLLAAAETEKESILLEKYAELKKADIEEISAPEKIAEIKKLLELIGNACEQYLASIKKEYRLSFLKVNDPVKVKYEYFLDILNIVRNNTDNEVQKMGKLGAKFQSAAHATVMKSLSQERGSIFGAALRDIVSWFTLYFRKSKLGEAFVNKLNTLSQVKTSGTDAEVLARSAEALVKTSPKLKPGR